MGSITIRRLREEDAAYFAAEECAQGWHSTPAKLEMRLQDEKNGMCVSFIAEVDGIPAGYVFLYHQPHSGAFAGQQIPEIADFAVLEKFRRHGIGNRLMDAAEAEAAKSSSRVCLGVGLHAGYGSAQRMYVKRGYIPDGSGVWYNDNVCPPYTDCENDDGLILYLCKEFSNDKISGTDSTFA